jgi:hypothetical protein
MKCDYLISWKSHAFDPVKKTWMRYQCKTNIIYWNHGAITKGEEFCNADNCAYFTNIERRRKLKLEKIELCQKSS